MTISEYAREQGISRQAAWERFKRGKCPADVQPAPRAFPDTRQGDVKPGVVVGGDEVDTLTRLVKELREDVDVLSGEVERLSGLEGRLAEVEELLNLRRKR